MEDFLAKNSARFEILVHRFVPRQDDGHKASDSNDKSDTVVCARVRPLLDEEASAGFRAAIFPRSRRSREHSNVVDLHELYNPPRGGPKLKSSSFRLDQIFGSESLTEELYETTVAPLVPFAWNGGISTLFAYGQTGSGKTFTISRLEQLAIRSLLNGSLPGQRKVHITIIELAGNSAFDLLNARKSVSILEDSFGATQVVGAQELLATDVDVVLSAVEAANAFRRTAATLRNDQSSRSHAICRIRIENTDKYQPDAAAEDGLLYLIDLAGSEVARDRSQHALASDMREAIQINKSLSVLKDCIRGKAEADAVMMQAADQSSKNSKHKAYVPFRQSALTKVLKHVFDPASRRACKTVVIACVNPSNGDCGPSRNTLRYAQMLRVMVPAPKATVYDPWAPSTWSNSQLKDFIKTHSGDPPILTNQLAPYESGAQLLRLPELTFEQRCMETPGVTLEQAKAFRSKLWQMHIDSASAAAQQQQQQQRTITTTRTELDAGPDTSLGSHRQASSSREPDQALSASVSFKQRVRPGMVVRFTPRREVLVTGREGMAVVLCPVAAVGSHVKDSMGAPVVQKAAEDVFLCALLSPGSMLGSYEVNLWRQCCVGLAEMDAEVILEYDGASRYYYVAL